MKIILKGELPDDLTSIGLKPGHLLNAEVEPGSQRSYFDCHVTDFKGSVCVSCMVEVSNYLIPQTSMPAPDPGFLEIEVREGSDDYFMFQYIVNQGIDSHLEGFTLSEFGYRYYESVGLRAFFHFHKSEIPILVRRMEEAEEDIDCDIREIVLGWVDEIRDYEFQ